MSPVRNLATDSPQLMEMMMMTMRNALTTAAFAAGMVLVPAVSTAQETKEIPLKDGSTLVVFKDGKMSMRDKSGKSSSMKDGMVMETKDGKVYVMKGNEIWRKTTTEQMRDELYKGS
jgi:hypothetical protein